MRNRGFQAGTHILCASRCLEDIRKYASFAQPVLSFPCLLWRGVLATDVFSIVGGAFAQWRGEVREALLFFVWVFEGERRTAGKAVFGFAWLRSSWVLHWSAQGPDIKQEA